MTTSKIFSKNGVLPQICEKVFEFCLISKNGLRNALGWLFKAVGTFFIFYLFSCRFCQKNTFFTKILIYRQETENLKKVFELCLLSKNCLRNALRWLFKAVGTFFIFYIFSCRFCQKTCFSLKYSFIGKKRKIWKTCSNFAYFPKMALELLCGAYLRL